MTTKQRVTRANAMVRNILADERKKKGPDRNEKLIDDLATAAYWLLRAVKGLK